ncbi:dut: dUTP diphosphatase [Rubrobacter radiotolerans]|uniref:Deoxyuridine 5'-triphosphate nucleotidohydrolase n=1 Tax=Rubrobacter radiotolerans TaxID=42256 RepID=A0A023X017_RUBRA|nr:dUTP diphosphatase [Rubrobacter radiotolerans]AHY45663.1 dut: dUTP diphosphatase [Rubrobacter radiotolerans]MDX5893077.1 dUTP diphosphatase [Rubrobacter radiotolerans]SMC03013.1 dUTP pyrophosphatase [Rubrobacter radiotolerans DSM 5868]
MSDSPALEVRFTKLRPDAEAPARAYSGDAGYDLRAAESAVLEPGGRAIVGTGVAVAIPAGYAGLVLPRSGLSARHGVTLINAPGLIDSGYRGELKVPLVNHDRSESFTVEAGMRVAQLVLVRAGEASFVEVASLERSADGRGAGGFGSSGA